MLSMGKSTISMVIFNSYVKLPEGKSSSYNRRAIRANPAHLGVFQQRFRDGIPTLLPQESPEKVAGCS